MNQSDGAPKQAQPRLYTSSIFQISAMVITAIILAFPVRKVLSPLVYIPLDQRPALLPITPAITREFGKNPGVIRVGLLIQSFSTFNVLQDEFQFSGIIWFNFDPSVVPLSTIEKFSVGKGEILSRTASDVIKTSEGRLIMYYNIKTKFKGNLDYRRFPLDDHTLFITIDNDFISPVEAIFESDLPSFHVSSNEVSKGWYLADRSVYTGYFASKVSGNHKEHMIYHPRVIFALYYSRTGYRQMLTILLPLLLIYFVAIFSFAMDPEKYYRSIIALSTGAITALLAYRFVIENLSPKLDQFMLVDYFFFMFLTAVCTIYFLNARTLRLSSTIKAIITIFLDIIIVVISIYLILVWRGL
jgi:hypothetical protein